MSRIILFDYFVLSLYCFILEIILLFFLPPPATHYTWLRYTAVNLCVRVCISIESPRRFASVTGDTDCFWTLRLRCRDSPFPPNSGKSYRMSRAPVPQLNVVFRPCFSQSLPEMMGELFQPHEMPEPPKQSFFIGLFGGGSRSIDREELCKTIYFYFQFREQCRRAGLGLFFSRHRQTIRVADVVLHREKFRTFEIKEKFIVSRSPTTSVCCYASTILPAANGAFTCKTPFTILHRSTVYYSGQPDV